MDRSVNDRLFDALLCEAFSEYEKEILDSLPSDDDLKILLMKRVSSRNSTMTMRYTVWFPAAAISVRSCKPALNASVTFPPTMNAK